MSPIPGATAMSSFELGSNKPPSFVDINVLPLEKNPELVEKPEIAAKTAILFWKTYVQPRVSNWDDVTAITKVINGGYNGLDDRKMRYAAFKQAMNVA